jgi:hypothetical protein
VTLGHPGVWHPGEPHRYLQVTFKVSERYLDLALEKRAQSLENSRDSLRKDSTRTDTHKWKQAQASSLAKQTGEGALISRCKLAGQLEDREKERIPNIAPSVIDVHFRIGVLSPLVFVVSLVIQLRQIIKMSPGNDHMPSPACSRP